MNSITNTLITNSSYPFTQSNTEESDGDLKKKLIEILSKHATLEEAEASAFMDELNSRFNFISNKPSSSFSKEVMWQLLYASQCTLDHQQQIQLGSFSFKHLSPSNLAALYQALSYYVNRSTPTQLSQRLSSVHLPLMRNYFLTLCQECPKEERLLEEAFYQLECSWNAILTLAKAESNPNPKTEWELAKPELDIKVDFSQVLPKDVITYIFAFLSPFDISRVSLVSKKFYALSKTDQLWKNLVQKIWLLPDNYTPDTNWQAEFSARFTKAWTNAANDLPEDESLERDVFENNKQILKSGLRDGETLLRVLQLVPRLREGISYTIKQHAITDQKALIEIAKLAVEENAMITSRHIEDYGITNEKERTNIAKLAVKKNGMAVSDYIKNYAITDEKERISIAKLAVQQDAKASIYIESYAITDEKERINIAKLAIQKNAEQASIYIQKYHITDEKERTALAKLAARQNGFAISQFIQKYNITAEVDRIEIAKLAAQQNGLGTTLFIQHYNITDEAARIEIAKLAAQQNGLGTSQFIQEYNITDEAALAEIFQLAVQQNSEAQTFKRYYTKSLMSRTSEALKSIFY